VPPADLRAGCSLADTITADSSGPGRPTTPRDRRLVRQHDAEVKASRLLLHLGQRRKVIDAIPADQEILFLPTCSSASGWSG
jgi:quinolinate synthase